MASGRVSNKSGREFGCTTVAADTEGLSVAVAIIEPAARATLSMSATSISKELAARLFLYALAKDSFFGFRECGEIAREGASDDTACRHKQNVIVTSLV